MTRQVRWLVTLIGLVLLTACATTYVEENASEARLEQIVFPPYSGTKVVAAVLPLGLSDRAAKAYPHLLAKDVGLGIHSRVVETLYDSKRFRFVEEKPEIVKDVMDRQWMSSAGMVDQATAVELGRMLGAQKVIYGEVYDFAQGGEQVSAFGARQGVSTRVGVQVRCVDVETLEYVPGSGEGRGQDVGDASGNAIQKAILSLVKRLN